LFNKQIITGDYSKTLFLVQSAALFAEIMPMGSIRQGLTRVAIPGKISAN